MQESYSPQPNRFLLNESEGRSSSVDPTSGKCTAPTSPGQLPECVYFWAAQRNRAGSRCAQDTLAMGHVSRTSLTLRHPVAKESVFSEDFRRTVWAATDSRTLRTFLSFGAYPNPGANSYDRTVSRRAVSWCVGQIYGFSHQKELSSSSK